MSELYENPLIKRYAGKEMAENFSDEKKFRTWRKLWVALAETEKELGIPITQAQIDELKTYQDKLNLDVAETFEHKFRHDVMAHVHAYGEQCPLARPIIHLGATSAFVGDNTDIILMRDGLEILKAKLLLCIKYLKDFALKFKSTPTLGFTHFQPAQLTTVGKRACLWIQDFLMDLEDLLYIKENLKLRGAKGTTGTQASFLKLFNGDSSLVKLLDEKIAQKFGFNSTFPVTGQTYTRKLDFRVLSVLSGIAQSAHKFSNDIRLLQHLKEVEEPFESSQVGSSAMAYKRNPMRSERTAALSRYIIVTVLNTAITAASQWFERTLDDSANRRIVIPEAFLATDAILNLCINISKGLSVNHAVIEKHINEELPFMATENIIMEAVKSGKDRQAVHERIRIHSISAAENIKKGGDNDLLERLASDDYIGMALPEIKQIIDPAAFCGRSSEQVDEFINGYVNPVLYKLNPDSGNEDEIKI